MPEVKKIATRDSYGNALAELGREHDNLVVLDADLAAATKTGVFQKEFPDRQREIPPTTSSAFSILSKILDNGDSFLTLSNTIHLFPPNFIWFRV